MTSKFVSQGQCVARAFYQPPPERSLEPVPTVVRPVVQTLGTCCVVLVHTQRLRWSQWPRTDGKSENFSLFRKEQTCIHFLSPPAPPTMSLQPRFSTITSWHTPWPHSRLSMKSTSPLCTKVFSAAYSDVPCLRKCHHAQAWVTMHLDTKCTVLDVRLSC